MPIFFRGSTAARNVSSGDGYIGGGEGFDYFTGISGNFTAYNIFNNKKLEDMLPSSTTSFAPNISRGGISI